MTDEDSAEKPFAASEQKLARARRQGEVALSRDLLAAAGLGGLLLAFLAGPGNLAEIGQLGAGLLEKGASLPPLGDAGLAAVLRGAGLQLVWLLLPFFCIPAMAVVLALLAQNALVFATARLRPRLSRVSPIAGARNRLGLSGLVEFAKSTLKLLVTTLLLGLFLALRADGIVASLAMEARPALLLLFRLLIEFLLMLLAAQLVIGFGDLLWQRLDHAKRQRMTRKEALDEARENEGDPHAKAHRRRRAQELAGGNLAAAVAGADVIVVNPRHYAVALRWDRAGRGAPVCVAKGVDEMARRIRELAAEKGVPVRRDPPAARAIHASVDIGEEIRPEHYRAIAAAIRFADAMRGKARHAKEGPDARA